jgi:hypothetical protein
MTSAILTGTSLLSWDNEECSPLIVICSGFWSWDWPR